MVLDQRGVWVRATSEFLRDKGLFNTYNRDMLRRSAYSAALREFLSAPDNEVLGVLISAQHGEVPPH